MSSSSLNCDLRSIDDRTWSAEEGSSSSLPFFLRRLSRSPKEILRKKAEMGQVMVEEFSQMVNVKENIVLPDGEVDHVLEKEIQQRLFYILQICNLKKKAPRKSLQELAAHYQHLDQDLGAARQRLDSLLELRGQLEARMAVVKKDQQGVAAILGRSDETALKALSLMQEQLRRAEEQLAQAAEVAGTERPASSFRRVFAPTMVDRPLGMPDLSKPPPVITQV